MRRSHLALHAALLAGLAALWAAPLFGQQKGPAPTVPCTADQVVGTWERVSLLRDALSVQPPDAPLFVKFGADGYWSMMEMPDDRPKIDKPLNQQTEKELWSRFERVEGGYGTWTIHGDILTRKHLVNIAPGGEGNNQDRLCWFEGEILALVGMGANRSPQARFKRLPAQPLKSTSLVGTWERIAFEADGKPGGQRAPQILILGEDGWFSQTLLPPGRKPVGKPLEKYTVDDYVRSFAGVEAARGTYSVQGEVLTRKHVANIDPNMVGTSSVRQFSLDRDTLTLRGTNRSGQQIVARFRRLSKERGERRKEKENPLISFLLPPFSSLQGDPYEDRTSSVHRHRIRARRRHGDAHRRTRPGREQGALRADASRES